MRLRHTVKKRVLFPVVLLSALVMVLVYLGVSWLEAQEKKPEPRSDHTLRYSYEPTLEVNGKRYRSRDQLTTILLMGIDRAGDAVSFGYRNGGQADFLRLMVIDGRNKTVAQLQIDRDTITPITVLSVMGTVSGKREAQIGLSHGFGDGGALSCRLTVNAVSEFLKNADIDYYMALDMDGISVLNDWVGGVPIMLTEDMTAIDPAMVQGATVTLMGGQAERFVRSRLNVGDGTNAMRMQRQQAYVAAFVQQLEKAVANDQTRVHALLEAVEDELVTNMPKGRMINEFWAARQYEQLPVMTIAGSHSIGKDGFVEFHADREALDQMVMALFYEEVR